MMATKVEAIIAAVYEDGKFSATANVMKALGLLKAGDDGVLVMFSPFAGARRLSSVTQTSRTLHIFKKYL